MNIDDFDFPLPAELIAQYPLAKRSSSRLLHLDRKTSAIRHLQFPDFVEFLTNKDLLIFNDTKVFPARLFGQKSTGGKVEILIERILADNRAITHIKSNKPLKIGTVLIFNKSLTAKVISRHNDLFELSFSTDEPLHKILETIGNIPLPPYINRPANDFDKARYQTIYAKQNGAVAAPTAGLHFDDEIMEKIANKNVNTGFITLHVGAGTFQPIREQNIFAHKMHSEYMEISSTICEQIKLTKQNGGKIIAVGTTCMRALESASLTGEIKPFNGETDIFIYPGFKFNCVDTLLTNFHLPRSTLLLLICAFANIRNIMHAYQEAIERRYRFFSYGDAMLID